MPNTVVSWVLVVAAAAAAGCFRSGPFLVAEASSAAGTETLVGIVGKDFVLLGADSSVSQSIALTASNLDKIAPLADPFPDAYGDDGGSSSSAGNPGHSPDHHWKRRTQRRNGQLPIIAAAAGDAADSDRLLSYLRAIGSVEEYTNGGVGCDVRHVSLDDEESVEPSGGGRLRAGGGLDARSMAHLARRCIWEKLRSRTPYRICLLVAGMVARDGGRPGSTASDSSGAAAAGRTGPAFASQKVQKQVRQAWKAGPDTETGGDTAPSDQNGAPTGPYQPRLYWLDEYGSCQEIQYGAHGHGANFLLSLLDQNYRPDLTRAEAIRIMNECFEELRNRYVINSPEAPCIKCVDARGIRWLPPSVPPQTQRGRQGRTSQAAPKYENDNE
ncbi:unnamed protein product [Pseudo-nitzschia multistriata]|uniref:Proteasome subunit beta n=1 Tax=Pseudo-nitzschia multistriata TaxID=183589 RepID=A0A448ZKC6_9STRA|nr:unnamed protein product [Pseudo-nitzschia multistriata]